MTALEVVKKVLEIHKQPLNPNRIYKIAEELDLTKELNLSGKDFVELLFSYPYTKIESVEKKLNISRQTASKYLKICEKLGAFRCIKLGRINYFVNLRLFEILKRGLVL